VRRRESEGRDLNRHPPELKARVAIALRERAARRANHAYGKSERFATAIATNLSPVSRHDPMQQPGEFFLRSR
jgi:hypothetical protein